ncbi:hydrolase [Ligilactobacillus salitolerans]|uniref:Hydrolase n=1 Tax=Ligilactobacillus salitolerans TaxID=1808352 RepID=A0A401ISE0_9LACO|nr:alpha/beta hydrolase [Ligilactobacillus salitolerans]GBG94427.1 hydrolase [Ligilactobacillus salitolerans]
MDEQFVTTDDGIKWHMYETGPANKTTIVLFAGFPESAYAWRKVWPMLAQHYHVLAIDLPGQGYSSVPQAGYDTKTTAKRIHGLLEQLNLQKIVYVGHDIGSWVGFTYAHLFPADLLGMVLVDANIPGVTLSQQIELNTESWRSWHFLFNALPDLPEELLAGKEQVLLEWFFSHKAQNWREAFTQADIDEYDHEYQQLGVLRGMLGYYRAVLQDFEINAQLSGQQVDLPLLAVSGELGSSRDLNDKLKSMGYQVKGAVIAESGHYIPEEKPAKLVEQIGRFTEKFNK